MRSTFVSFAAVTKKEMCKLAAMLAQIFMRDRVGPTKEAKNNSRVGMREEAVELVEITVG